MIYDSIIRFFYRRWINACYGSVLDYMDHLEMLIYQLHPYSPPNGHMFINLRTPKEILQDRIDQHEAIVKFENLKALFPDDYLVYLLAK